MIETSENPVLEVVNLKTQFKTATGIITAVDDVSFRVNRGETLGVVGESGSGKSVTSLSIMRLVPQPTGRIVGGRVLLNGRDILSLSEQEMRHVRGNEVAMIFQDPMTSLNPVFTIGNQIVESIMLHEKKTNSQARENAAEALDLVGISEPRKTLDKYAHQLSGGMRQRVMIAMALSCNPKLLIADEPTTALDVTIQAQILELMQKLQRDIGMAILFITHDLGVVAELADRVVVMYTGRVVEQAPVEDLFFNPRMPYTISLLKSIPRVGESLKGKRRLESIQGVVASPQDLPKGCSFHPRCQFATDACLESVPEMEDCDEDHVVRCVRWKDVINELDRSDEETGISDSTVPNEGSDLGSSAVLVRAQNLQTYFPVRGGVFSRVVGHVHAVEDISFEIRSGEVLAFVGESGSGKTTAGRSTMRLLEPTAGSIEFEAIDLLSLNREELRAYRKDIQLIFQDPFSSLDPRMTVGQIVSEGIEIHKLAKGKAKESRVIELLESVGLSASDMQRYPHEFSGGQAQRIGIARALAVEPKLIIADEPVSALDVSIQAQVVNLLQDLKEKFGLTLLFIAHDLGIVEYIADRVVVMYLGRIMEAAPANELYSNPVHPYTEALLSAIPIPKPNAKRNRILLEGDIPSPMSPPSGCVFRTRCPIAVAECAQVVPPMEQVSPEHYKACIRR
jgi:peptide/nickel transport system ATP-binding protein